MTDDFLALLENARLALGSDADPDGETSLRALALAIHATAAADWSDQPADWDMCSATIDSALLRLTQDRDHNLADNARLAIDGLPSVGTDRPELRAATVGLLARLADLCAQAAMNSDAPPARRLVWAEVAHRLDAASRELL